LSGFTTQDINRCQTTARTCALVYNGWGWYCRTANPSARMQAITSRPLLLAAVPDTTAWQGQHSQNADCEHPCGFAAREGHCAAVQGDRPMGCTAALCERQDCASTWPIQTAGWATGYGVTAGFRVTVLNGSKYGRLISTPQPNAAWEYLTYILAKGYEGYDAFVLQVEGNGQTVQLRYFVYVSEDTGADMFSNKNCKGIAWKISQTTPDTSADNLATWQRASDLSTLLANASQTLTGFADLPSSAVGNTVGAGSTASITLDTTAAGHNWYIDPMPLDNTDDYLPTSNPNVWQAKISNA
jgi:hypothetical protein